MAYTTIQVQGLVTLPTDEPAAGYRLKFELRKADKDSALVVPHELYYTIPSDGIIDVALWPNARGIAGTTYNVYLIPPRQPDPTHPMFTLTLPDVDGPLDIWNYANLAPPPTLSDAEAIEAAALGYLGEVETLVGLYGTVVDIKGEAEDAAALAELEAEGAEAAADLAELWAEGAEGVEVEAGKYSARHHSAESLAQRLLAETARDAAETARDAAFVSANVYDDTTAGLAATVDGEQFQVVEGDDIVRYENDTGAAVEVARYSSAAFVSDLSDEVDTLSADQARSLSVAYQNIFPEITDDPNITELSVVGGSLYFDRVLGRRCIVTGANPSGTTNRRIEVDVTDWPAGQLFSTAVTVVEKSAGSTPYSTGVGIHIRMRAYNSAGSAITNAWSANVDQSDTPSDGTIFRRYLGQAAITNPTRLVIGEAITLPTGCVKIGFEVYVTNTDDTSAITDFTLRRGYVSDYLGDDGFNGSSKWHTEPVPLEVGWDHDSYPIMPRVAYNASGRPYGGATLEPEDVFPDYSGWQDIYVDRSSGDDDTGDGSSGSKFATIARGIKAMNDSDAPANIIVTGGAAYNGFQSFAAPYHTDTDLRNQVLEQDVRFVASGSVTVNTTRSPSWTADPTYSHVYKTSTSGHSGAGRVVDLVNRNPVTGKYHELRKVASLALCAVIPNSWYTDGSTVWVFRADGVAPNATTNTRVLNEIANFKLSTTSAVNVFFDVEDGASGWDLEGGSNAAGDEKGGCIAVELTANQASQKVFVGRNVRLRYSSSEGQVENGFCVYNWHGFIGFWNSDASYNGRDGWNIHALGAYTNQPYWLLVNCSAHENGVLGAASANSWTLHESCIGVVIGGDFTGGTGLPIYVVGSSRGFIHGMRMRGGLGDYSTGISIKPIMLGASGTSILYLSRCTLEPNSYGQAVGFALDTASIRVRHTLLPGSVYADAGAAVEGW